MSTANIKGIMLDFDGVILESNWIKANAFRTLFSDYPEHGDRIERLHFEHGGMSRFEKLEIIHRDFLKKPLAPREAQQLSAKFMSLVDGHIMTCPFVPGAEEFIRRYSTQYELFIISGTPQDELRDQMRRRGINHYFRSIFGAPRKKPELVKGILTRNHWSPGHAIFVGDSIDDQIAAAENSVHFIGRVPVGNHNPFTGRYHSKTVCDLTKLSDSWENLINP